MSDLLHWHGVPSVFCEPPDCCRSALEGALSKQWDAADRQRDTALRDERRRIVAALSEGIDTWERIAGPLLIAPVASAAAELRHLLAKAGCTCPQVEATKFGDTKLSYLRGLDPHCAVHP